ncbi:hypothetical protein MPTK1_1g07100 [Marchantia polymorpha subsp. ruderalis]|uniref:Uncharacterized protein n=2 Tax=Marchantia polymorpha TaxID=3197 RepID=A0AAF6AMF8_MARPO|nr:hypothetical protein MARPO_0043s0103 [Marchantia polymorpha]BBM97628.1 hypothetical protein Mp_1g07100 [Marchantia polymorpha subsp. ruderalis]|eukprot:PTQ39870.1 hypothetical protein MARPO_0043s0103 [Marchantia polymorpha]
MRSARPPTRPRTVTNCSVLLPLRQECWAQHSSSPAHCLASHRSDTSSECSPPDGEFEADTIVNMGLDTGSGITADLVLALCYGPGVPPAFRTRNLLPLPSVERSLFVWP